MRAYLYILLMLLLSCSCSKKEKRTKMKDHYLWGPAASAPLLFPVELRYAYFTYSDSCRYRVINTMLYNGIASGSSGVSLNGYDDGRGLPLPDGFKSIWLSKADRKVYKTAVKFTESQKQRMLDLFRHGYDIRGYEDGTFVKMNYSTFCMSMLPGGQVLLHITGRGRSVCIDKFSSEELKDITMAELNFPYATDALTVQEHFDNALKYDKYKPMLEYMKIHGIPYDLWDKYMERFRYGIKIEFENEETKLKPYYGYSFANGEMFKVYDGVKEELLSRIQYTSFAWIVSDTVYTGHFYFNEEEVLRIFPLAYGNPPDQCGEFVIRVSKYNNWFDIVLRVGTNEYRFEKTQIHVFRQGIDEPDRNAVVYYDNYRGEKPTNFIGE